MAGISQDLRDRVKQLGDDCKAAGVQCAIALAVYDGPDADFTTRVSFGNGCQETERHVLLDALRDIVVTASVPIDELGALSDEAVAAGGATGDLADRIGLANVATALLQWSNAAHGAHELEMTGGLLAWV